MAEAKKPRCEYTGNGRFCPNPARWLVGFTTPDDGKAMRKRREEWRCHWHSPEKFFPKGASQFTTEGIPEDTPHG